MNEALVRTEEVLEEVNARRKSQNYNVHQQEGNCATLEWVSALSPGNGYVQCPAVFVLPTGESTMTKEASVFTKKERVRF